MKAKRKGTSSPAVAKKKARKKPSKTKHGQTLTNARLLELAAKNKPPQSWYDEDFDGI
jgi:hypothetical protein